MRRHILEPTKIHIFNPPADIHGLMHGPALVDIAHESDIWPDCFADAARVLGLACRSGVARKSQLSLHLLEALVDQCSRRLYQMIDRIGTHQGPARIGRHPVTQTSEHCCQGLAEKFSLDIPERHIDAGNRQH